MSAAYMTAFILTCRPTKAAPTHAVLTFMLLAQETIEFQARRVLAALVV